MVEAAVEGNAKPRCGNLAHKGHDLRLILEPRHLLVPVLHLAGDAGAMLIFC